MGRLLPAGAALAHTVLQGRAKRADFLGGVFSKGWKKAGWDLIFLVRPWKKAGWPKPPFSNTKCLTVLQICIKLLFSFLDRFLAKSSPFFSILPNFYFAPRSAAQLAHESRQPYAHPRHSEVCPCAPRPARTAPGQLISRSRLRVLASADPSARAVFALHSRSSSTAA